MNQKLAPLLSLFQQPQGVAPGTGPLLMAENGEEPMDLTQKLMIELAQPKPANVSTMESVKTTGAPQKYTNEFEDAFRANMEARQGQVNELQGKLKEAEGQDVGWLQKANLRPALAFADQLTGGNSAAYYQSPTAEHERKANIQRLEEEIGKQQGRLADDQLGYLKQRMTEENTLKREELANKRLSAMMGNKADNSEDRLRAQYLANPLYKGMAEISKAYESIKNNPATNGPAQQAMVYQFSRILDPGSVVRETEYAMSAGNAGKIAQARNFLNRLQSGEMLNPQQVALMKEVAGNLVNSARAQLDAHNKSYRELATRKGLNPDNVVIDAFKGNQAAAPGGGIMSPQDWLKSQGGR